MTRTFVRCSVLCFALVVTLVSCQVPKPIGPIRSTTLAPDLEYLPPEEVRTTMWVLAAEIRHLERLMTAPTKSEREALPITVRSTLERMRIAAKSLDEPGRTTQHPMINEHLGRFLSRIDRAMRAVDRDPPNYFPASTIAGSCFLCHGSTGNARLPAGAREFRVSRHVD